ncbi:MAG: pyridoxal phosphate-dependent decarboxylase family protein [Bdellovibrionota bacterium]
MLKNAGWDVEQDGLIGAPPIRILTSELRHGSIDRAVRFLGLGTRSMQSLPVDADGRIPLEILKSAMGQLSVPTVLILDAADLNIGAFDPFESLIPWAKERGAWVHIDGAFGLFARASRSKRALLSGVELADSWATDGHKWLNVPFDCGIALVRDSAAHRAAMTVSASYITATGLARDQVDWTPEWSRRARGVAVYAALRELGREGVEDLIDRCCRYCWQLVTEIGALPGAEILWEPKLNQGLVRFLDPCPGATEKDHDAKTEQTIAAINKTGEAFFSGTVWKCRKAMRISVVNWRTNDTDIRRAIDAVRSVLGKSKIEATAENRRFRGSQSE